jgi:hypothetical protein
MRLRGYVDRTPLRCVPSKLAMRQREPFLLYSVALSELAVFIDVEK